MSEREEHNVRRIWSDQDLDRALTALHADRSADEPALALARAELMQAAGGSAGTAPSTSDDARPRRHRGRWVAAAAVMSSVAAGVLVLQTVPLGGRPPVASAAAAELDSAAQKIGASDQPLGPGQYRYVATHAWWMASAQVHDTSYSYLAENLLETWVPADQHQEWLWRRDVTGARKWVQGTEEQARAAGVLGGSGWPEGEWKARCGDWFAADEGRQPCADQGSWQTPTAEFLAALPRDPQQLYQRLRADAPDNSRGAAEVLVYAADALRSGLIPADLRAALYQALGRLPGLQVTDRLANLDGRTGIAFGMDDGVLTEEIIVDPATGAFIGERQMLAKDEDGMKAGTVTEYTSVSTAVVDSMGAEPTR